MSDLKKSEEIEALESYPFIKGDTIDLCARNPKHEKLINRWKNDPRVRKYSRNVMPRTLSQDKKRREDHGSGLSDHVSFEIWHKKDNKPIGQGGLGSIDWISGWANAFMLIGEPEYWNKNIATEATRLLIDYAFNELNLNKIHGGVCVENIGSWSVAEKIGFKFEGIEKHEFYVDGKHLDVKIYCLLKEDWLNSKKNDK